MQLTIVVNIQTGERLYKLLEVLKEVGIEVNRHQLTQKDLCDIITDYYKITFEELLQNLDSKEDTYVIPKKFLCYFLQRKLGLTNKTLNQLLGYKEKSNIVFYNIKYIETMLDNKDVKYTRPYNNLKRLFDDFTPSLNTLL